MIVTSDGAPLCTAAASVDGGWTCTGSGELAAGPHTFKAGAEDPTQTPAQPATVAVTTA